VSVSDDGDGKVRVCVRDNGIGFSAETKPRLFEMFARGPSSTGLGIGLALVHRLVEMHGGSVDAMSEGEGRGAQFVITLPRVNAPAVIERRSDASTVNATRVLVVDDNRDAADSLAALLRTLGNEVIAVYDGVEAVKATRAFRPDVVLLDIGMPRLDGYAAAREIRRDAAARDTKIVALTGWGQDDDRRRAMDAGFDAHLVKPAELDALRRLLAEFELGAATMAAGAETPPRHAA
jgi:CheY-like chemotaxis protein